MILLIKKNRTIDIKQSCLNGHVYFYMSIERERWFTNILFLSFIIYYDGGTRIDSDTGSCDNY